MKALVTGAGGFVGSYVTKLLEQNGFEVFGIDKQFKPDATYYKYHIDINDMDEMERVIRDICPDATMRDVISYCIYSRQLHKSQGTF